MADLPTELREIWKLAKVELAEVEKLRKEATKHLDERWRKAYEAEDEAREALPNVIASCESCCEPIFDGDGYLCDPDQGFYECVGCAPTWEYFQKHFGDWIDLIASNEAEDEVFHTAETAQILIDRHITNGGNLTDSMAANGKGNIDQ